MIKERYYRPELDVLRFFAFLCIFFVHRLDLAPVDQSKHYWFHHISLLGNFGVPVFFLLSAFLITELLTREEEQTGKIHPKAFYVRRILRIWPLYFLVFYGWVLLSTLVPEFALPPSAWFAFTFFAGNWYISFNEWLPAYPLNPLWSISVEEQFYILIPLIAAYGGRKGLKIAAYLFFGIAYACIIYYGMHPTNGFNSAWTNSFIHFQFFSAGILLSLYLKGRLPKIPLILRLLMVFAALGSWWIAAMVCGIHADAPHLSTVVESVTSWLLILVGVILLFISFLGSADNFFPKPLLYLGKISYGLYVFHISFFWLIYMRFDGELVTLSRFLHMYEWRNTIGFVIAFMLTVVVSSLSYRLLEKPFLRLKKRFTFVTSRD